MATPMINGTRHSWASVEVELLGRIVSGITAIEYDDTQEKENVYGAGIYPVSRGRGKYEATAKITLLAYEVDAIQRSLGPGKRLQDIEPFDIPVVFMPEGSDGLVTHVIHNVEFTNNKRAVNTGDTNMEVELDLIVSHITWI